MGLLGSILNKAEDLGSDLLGEAKKFLNKDVMTGTMAACAMVANANGVVKPEEKRKIAGIIKRNETLKNYDTSEVLDCFNKFVDDYEFDADIGEGNCIKAISKIKQDGAKESLIRECIAIGKADGDFDENEKKAVREICTVLKIDSSIVT